PPTVVMLEEIQHLDEPAAFLTELVDLAKGRRILATASSSPWSRSRTRESPAERTRRVRLLPLSLDEVAASLPDELAPEVRDAHLAELWERLVAAGGYPEVWLADDPPAVLHRLAEASVLESASGLHIVERPGVLRSVLELAAADAGKLVNVSAWAAAVRASRTVVSRYLAILEEAHVLRLVPPYAGGRRGEVTGAPKVFFFDNGLRNAVFGGFAATSGRADRGALWENAVFGELAKRQDPLEEIFYWRSKNGAEIDFVARRQGRLTAIVVHAGELRRPIVSRAARSFLAAYRPACLGIVNGSLRLDLEVDGVKVRFRRPWELAEVLASDR
ncbi:MAG: DUF4143 domain-containing protein, partial [Thermoanaerobaculia bacterium]